MSLFIVVVFKKKKFFFQNQRLRLTSALFDAEVSRFEGLWYPGFADSDITNYSAMPAFVLRTVYLACIRPLLIFTLKDPLKYIQADIRKTVLWELL